MSACCGGAAWLAQQHALAAPPAPAWAAPFAEIAAPFLPGIGGEGPGLSWEGTASLMTAAAPVQFFTPAPGLSPDVLPIVPGGEVGPMPWAGAAPVAQPVPEPTTLACLALPLIATLFRRKNS